MSSTADQGIARLISVQSNTFVEINHDIIYMAILLLLIQEGVLSVTSGSSMCKKYWLNRLVKLAQEKVCLGEPAVPTWPYVVTRTCKGIPIDLSDRYLTSMYT